MMRRSIAALLAATLWLAPFPAYSQIGRVSIEAPVAPAPSVPAGAVSAAGFAPLTLAALTPGPALALTPLLAAPAAQPRAQPVSIAQPAPVQLLALAAEQAALSPEHIGRLYDSAPAAPDFTALSRIRTPPAPGRWRPVSVLLQPAAAVVNAWRLSRHEKRLAALGPGERVTLEELGMRQSLSEAHDAIKADRLQSALVGLTAAFQGRNSGWYRANSAYLPYQFQGHAYIRFVERAVKLAYERAHGRAKDAALAAEARDAARAGTLLGHEWRGTGIQDRDSAHCAQHALFNAISAAAGFAFPLSVSDFVERARAALNVRAETRLADVERSIGMKLSVDVGEGMGANTMERWARLLGMGLETRAAPRGDAQWSALLGRGRETVVGLRMFHERYKHTREEAALRGHDYEILHHSVYLLGAFDSPSRGARLYMVQDSGSGATDFYTAEELSAVASDVEVLEISSPVSVP